MQAIVSEICKIIKNNELADIVILTPSQVVSKRLLALCAKEAKILMGVTASTPLLLAKELCGPVLYAKNAPQLMEQGQVEDLLLDCLKKANGGKELFKHSQERATATLMQEIVSELDENCIKEAALLSCGAKVRTEALATIRADYTRAKTEARLWDRADLLKEALSQLAVSTDYDNTVFITLNCFSFTGLEQQLVAKLKRVEVIETTIPTLAELAGKADLVKCRSTEVEVRHILKDILKNGYPADECAVIYLTSDYADSLMTECELWGLKASVYGGVSFTGNRYYHMYKALQEWKQAKPITKKRLDGKYSSYAYNAEVLCSLLANQALPMERANEFIKLMHEYKAGWGKERYEQILDLAEAKAIEEGKPTDIFASWRSSVRGFLAATSEEGTPEEQKQALLQVLQGVNAKDPAAYSIIKKAINSITYLDEGETALGRLLELLQGTTYRSQSEGNGKLLCAPLKQAFFTGRKYLYICGMSRFALQGNRNESPLLLDAEKKLLQLKTIAEHEKENEQALRLLLGEPYESIQISYNYFDTQKMIELQPAPLFRQLQGAKPVENIDYLKDELQLSVSDHIKSRGSLTRIAIAQPKVAVPDLEKHVKGLVYSASGLETALGCPFKFFMQKVLGLYPYQEPVSNEDSWLESKDLGTLCHDVLEQYYKNGLKPYDEAEVEKELTAAVERLKKKMPLTKTSAMEADIAKAREMIKRAMDWTSAKVKEVKATELKFGTRYEAPEVILPLSPDLAISVHGSIDRLETREIEGEDQTFVLDYKSGKEYKSEKLETRVQPFLYALVAEKLAELKNESLEVKGSSYLFLKDSVKEQAVAQDKDSRNFKKNTLASLICNWLAKEKRIETRCPSFVLKEDGTIEGTAQELLDEEAAQQALAEAKKDNYCDSCDFKAFCRGCFENAEEGEEADD